MYFNQRLQEAKDAVSEPPQPKVKLRLSAKTPELPPKITLRFGQKAASDSANGVTVDSEALKRQQELVKAGANGHTAIANGEASMGPVVKNGIPIASQTQTLNQLPQGLRSGSAISPPLSANGVKSELLPIQTPVVVAQHGSHASNGTLQSPHLAPMSMPPPTGLIPRLPSGSPHPQATHTSHSNHMSNPLDSRWRQPGKGTSSM